MIVDQLFHQTGADGHDRLAVDLSLMAERIDDRADVVGGNKIMQLDPAGFRIDFHLRHLRDKRSRRAFARHFGFDADGDRSPFACTTSLNVNGLPLLPLAENFPLL